MRIDCIIPARDEAPTVADNIAAALDCKYVREIIVVDDGSTDGTADVAREAGAKVISREESDGSKAHAMDEGVGASDAEAILFLDADCTGLTAAHLDAICAPVVEGRAVLSLGVFDYGRFWNRLVVLLPPLTGERIIPRWVWESIAPENLDGYTIEMRINEVVAKRRLPTVARTMHGVSHRTKRDKLGRRRGMLSTVHMYGDLIGMVWPFGDIPVLTYWSYLRSLTVER